MPRSNKKSWRLIFVDIDSSYSIQNTTSPISAFFAARAPKGEQRAMYFGPGNGAAIDAMMGVASAHWPDLVEAKSFNEEYGCYISAPPGTSLAYPSYFGGFYVTRDGIYKFWNVTDKQELAENSGFAFKAKVQVGLENLFNRKIAQSAQPKSTAILTFPEVPASYDNPPNEWLLLQHTDGGAPNIILSPPKVMTTPSMVQYDPMKKGRVDMSKGAIRASWGSSENGWTFFDDPTLGYVAKLDYFGYTKAEEKAMTLRTWVGDDIYKLLVDDVTAQNPTLTDEGITRLRSLMTEAFFSVPNGTEDPDIYSIPFELSNMFFYAVDINDITYAYFMQKSATEKKTNVKISQIGYDKYIYDQVMPWSIGVYDSNEKLWQIDWTGSAISDSAEQTKLMDDVEFVAITDANKKEIKAILEKVPRALKTDPIFWTDVTANFATQRITTFQGLTGLKANSLIRKIYYVVSKDEIKHQMTEEEYIAEYGEDGGKQAYTAGIATGESAAKQWKFNTMTVSCSEEVYAGKQTSGGEFTGSFDEQGKDSYGSMIYYPNILTDDDFSFIEVRVVRPFDDDGEDCINGFWKWDRVIDKFDIDQDKNRPTEKTFSIEGDRYCDLVMHMNLLERRLGGAWRDEYTQIVSDALDEMLSPEYDDAYIFIEPTGQEQFKSKLPAIRKAQEFATVIAPKILTPNSKGLFTTDLANKVVVNARMEGTAIFAGEFQVYDSIASKKYYRQPIGDVACNLARIMDKKLGGWAPAWTNITGGLGGQLKTVCIGSRYSFEDNATKVLDQKGVNPIAYNSDDGVMILSHKSTKDPNQLSDWSFLGHSMSFDLCKREIRDNVMRQQIVKPINDYWMGIRQTQVDAILAKRTGGTQPIWSSATCDIKGVNTSLTALERKFCIRVAVRVYVFSELVELTFEVLAQQ